jgi:hypothetical protein
MPLIQASASAGHKCADGVADVGAAGPGARPLSGAARRIHRSVSVSLLHRSVGKSKNLRHILGIVPPKSLVIAGNQRLHLMQPRCFAGRMMKYSGFESRLIGRAANQVCGVGSVVVFCCETQLASRVRSTLAERQ